jgi:hypothetical protein
MKEYVTGHDFLNQQIHYIIKYCLISPTYVSAPVEPSSGVKVLHSYYIH